MYRPLGFIAALMVAGSAGCGSLTSMGAMDPTRPRFDLITQDQILSAGGSDLYELIRKIRPYWILKGGDDTSENPGVIYVFFDGTRMGGLEALRSLPTSGINYIRWLDGIQAASRWGLDHERGVIYVSTQPLVVQ